MTNGDSFFGTDNEPLVKNHCCASIINNNDFALIIRLLLLFIPLSTTIVCTNTLKNDTSKKNKRLMIRNKNKTRVRKIERKCFSISVFFLAKW